jgi:hypothetical protein
MKTCWVLISPDSSGKYLATPGHQYAALLSVDDRAKLSDVTSELENQDFQVSYSWQSGQTMRSQSGIDAWLATLPAPTKGTVWMYLELTLLGGVPRSIVRHIKKCILFICGSVDISYVFEAQQVDDSYQPCNPGEPVVAPTVEPNAACPACPLCPALPPPCPGCSPPPNPWKPAIAGAAAGGGMVAGVLWWLWRRRRRR